MSTLPEETREITGVNETVGLANCADESLIL